MKTNLDQQEATLEEVELSLEELEIQVVPGVVWGG